MKLSLKRDILENKKDYRCFDILFVNKYIFMREKMV